MSFHLTNLAWDIEMKGNQKIVLLALAHMGIQSTGMCAATVARLAFMCGLSDSCVRDQLKTLIGLGYIHQVSGPNAAGVHMYRLNKLLETVEPTE